MEGLKRYIADLLSDDAGINKVSLVENPAFGATFSCFSAIQSRYQIQDEERRIVFGPLIIPDVPILRNDPIPGGPNEYTVEFSREAIRKFRDKFFHDKNIDQTNINHATDVDGLYVVSSMIKGDEGQPRPEFEDFPDGTWFVGFKVENEDVWQRAKSGDMGFSQEILYDLIDSGKSIPLNNQHFQSMTKKSFSRFADARNKLRESKDPNLRALGKILTFSRFGSVMTNRGELAYDGNLVQGKEGVTLLTEGMDPVVADGEFTLITDDERNGLVISIDNGTVTVGEEQATEQTDMEAPAETPNNAPAEAQVEQAEQDVAALESLVEYIDERIENLGDTLEDIKESISTEFKSVISSHFAGIKADMDRLNNSIKAPATKPERTPSSFASTSGMGTVMGSYMSK